MGRRYICRVVVAAIELYAHVSNYVAVVDSVMAVSKKITRLGLDGLDKSALCRLLTCEAYLAYCSHNTVEIFSGAPTYWMCLEYNLKSANVCSKYPRPENCVCLMHLLLCLLEVCSP